MTGAVTYPETWGIYVGADYGATMQIAGNVAFLDLGGISGDVSLVSGSVDYLYVGDAGVSGTLYIDEDLTNSGWVDGPLSGGVHIQGRVDGAWVTTGPVTATGVLQMDEAVLGTMTFLDNLDGQVTVVYFVPDLVQVDGSVGGALTIGTHPLSYDVTAAVHIGGDLTGTLVIGKPLSDPGEDGSHGHVRVDGSLGTTDGLNPGSIVLSGGLAGSTTYVAIDFDGYDPNDRWNSGSTVTAGNEVYTGNEPGARIVEITPCKGDMNNDHAVDFADIDPFIAALFDGTEYNNSFPWLSQSRLFHGDLTLDQQVDFADIDPFVARLFGPCSPDGGYLWYDGLGAPGEGEQMMMAGGDGAAILAAQLAANVSAEHMGILLDAVTELAANPPDGAVVAWDEVLANLANQ